MFSLTLGIGTWDGPASSCHNCHSPFPSRLGCQPHTGEVKPLNGTLENADGSVIRTGPEQGEGGPPTGSWDVGALYSSLETSLSPSIPVQPPSLPFCIPLYTRVTPSSYLCPSELLPQPRANGSHIRVVTANHLSIGDLVTKAICGFVGIHRHIQHIRGVDTAEGH